MAQKILIVEDDVDFRAALAMVLDDVGFEVAEAWNGRAALEYLRSHAPPEAVILDLEMPIMDGEAFCAEKDRDPSLARIPVIMVSAHPDLGDGVRPEGMVEWLRKPIDVAVLLRTIRRVAGAAPAEDVVQDVA